MRRQDDDGQKQKDRRKNGARAGRLPLGRGIRIVCHHGRTAFTSLRDLQVEERPLLRGGPPEVAERGCEPSGAQVRISGTV